jgi:hypothetical protein
MHNSQTSQAKNAITTSEIEKKPPQKISGKNIIR